MARKPKIAGTLAEIVCSLAAPGVRPQTISNQLRTYGHSVDYRTIQRFLDSGGCQGRPAAAAAAAAATTTSSIEAEVTDVVASGSLQQLRDRLESIRALITALAPGVQANQRADVMSFAQLVNLEKQLLATLVELEPKPEAELDRLEALGEVARQELLRSAREAAGR